jgi:hypothetical protein
MIAYLPKEKVLLQGDFTVTPGQPANDHVKGARARAQEAEPCRSSGTSACIPPQCHRPRADFWAVAGK